MMVIGIIGILISIILIIIYGIQEEGLKVNCYDVYGNEIIGAECISKGGDLNEYGSDCMIFLFSSFLMLFTGIIATVLDNEGNI